MNKIKYYLWLSNALVLKSIRPVIIFELLFIGALLITLLFTGCVNSSSLGLN